MTKDQIITFSSYHLPLLPAGTYEFEVQQESGPTGERDRLFVSNKLPIAIEAPRFTLASEIIHAIYPLPGASGSFMEDLPSLTLNRVSLPWERTGHDHRKEGDSWLYLFLADDDDRAFLEEGTCKVTELFSNTAGRETYGETWVNYLKIPREKRELYFPAEDERNYFAHCRTDAETNRSVLLCNRLPKPGSVNTVYLLSKENRKDESLHETYIYLFKWQFYCYPTDSYLIPADVQDKSIEKLRGYLFTDEGLFEQAIKKHISNPDNDTLQSLKTKYRATDGGFHDFLKRLPGKLSSFAYPFHPDSLDQLDPSLSALLKQGGVLLKEADTYKAYRSPLQAAPVEIDDFSAHLAPALLHRHLSENKDQEELITPSLITAFKRYITSEIPDRSYQVAYQLGLLTALKDEEFNKPFYSWKQEVCTALLAAKTAEHPAGSKTSHLLSTIRKLDENKPIPPVVTEKIENWKSLKDIPFSYLIPSSRMLPAESIRYFCLDTLWVNSFLMGAFSIGNSAESIEHKLFNLYKPLMLTTHRFGFLIQSLAVSGWPDYTVEASFVNKKIALQLERKKIAKNIELFLYEGDNTADNTIKKLTFSPPAGKTRHGFRHDSGIFKKQFRPPGASHDLTLTAKFHGLPNYRKINAQQLLSEATATPSPAFFGMMMLEGTPKVEFNLET